MKRYDFILIFSHSILQKTFVSILSLFSVTLTKHYKKLRNKLFNILNNRTIKQNHTNNKSGTNNNKSLSHHNQFNLLLRKQRKKGKKKILHFLSLIKRKQKRILQHKLFDLKSSFLKYHDTDNETYYAEDSFYEIINSVYSFKTYYDYYYFFNHCQNLANKFSQYPGVVHSSIIRFILSNLFHSKSKCFKKRTKKPKESTHCVCIVLKKILNKQYNFKQLKLISKRIPSKMINKKKQINLLLIQHILKQYNLFFELQLIYFSSIFV